MTDTARIGWHGLALGCALAGWAVLACDATPPSASEQAPSSEVVRPAAEGSSAAGAAPIAPASGGAPGASNASKASNDSNDSVGGNASKPAGSGAGGRCGDTGSGGSAGSGASGGGAGASGRDEESSSDEQRYAILFEHAPSARTARAIAPVTASGTLHLPRP